MSPSKSEAPPPSQESASLGRSHLAWAEKLAVPLAAVIVSAAGIFVSATSNERLKVREIESQMSQVRLQREVGEAQVVVSLIPSIVKGTRQERAAAMRVLTTLAPVLATGVADAIASEVPASDHDLLQEVRVRSREAEGENRFREAVEDASRYFAVGLHGQAARAFLDAAKRMPASVARQVDSHRIEAARKSYERGDAEKAAAELREVFSSTTEVIETKGAQ